MANLLDLMTEEDRKKSVEAYKKRMAGDTSYRKNHKISPELYLIAELGYYYGWQAVVDVKRGFTDGIDGERIPLSMEEVCILVEAARKVWYSKVIDNSRGTFVATGSSLSKHPDSSFQKGMKKYIKEATV